MGEAGLLDAGMNFVHCSMLADEEFELEIAKDLTVVLTSKTGTGSVDRMPLISAVQVLRVE